MNSIFMMSNLWFPFESVEFSSSGVAFTKVVFEAEMNSGKLVK